MGLLTFTINVTLDGCVDHRAGVADDELLDFFGELVESHGALLYGRTTYELMEAAWPALVHDEKAPRAMREWAKKIDAVKKVVVSNTRRDFPWNHTVLLEGELESAVRRLKDETPRGVLAGSPKLGAELERLGLIDEVRLAIHPVLAGHGPTLFQGIPSPRKLELVSSRRLRSGVITTHYRRA